VVPGRRDVGGEPAERVGAVDQRLEVVPGAGRRLPGAPQRRVRGSVCPLPAVALQAASMMGDDEPLDSGPDCVVQAIDPRQRHAIARVSAHTPAKVR
jgi:hypothetical protein